MELYVLPLPRVHLESCNKTNISLTSCAQDAISSHPVYAINPLTAKILKKLAEKNGAKQVDLQKLLNLFGTVALVNHEDFRVSVQHLCCLCVCHHPH